MDFKLSSLTEAERRLYIPLVMMSEDLSEARRLMKAGADIEMVIELISNGLGYVRELEEGIKRYENKAACK
jgi:hypothetical protein